jgi:hypothetical protein
MVNRHPQTAVRFTPEDLALIERLQKKLGIMTRADLIRLALRSLATEHGVRH